MTRKPLRPRLWHHDMVIFWIPRVTRWRNGWSVYVLWWELSFLR